MKCNWPIGNGKILEFDTTDDKSRNPVAGIYIFCQKLSDGSWKSFYIGQTEDFSSRLATHERIDEAIRSGATSIHTLPVADKRQRDMWERMLIQHIQPPMNTQGR